MPLFWVIPLALLVSMGLIFLEMYRFQQQGERIAELAERLQLLAKKIGMPAALVRRLKYRRFAVDSYIDIREIARVLTRLERSYKVQTPYRLRRMALVSTDEVLDHLEQRLEKLEKLVAALAK